MQIQILFGVKNFLSLGKKEENSAADSKTEVAPA